MSRSPIRDAFVAIARNPALVLHEIAWRWTLGIAIWLLLAFTFFNYLGSLTISNTDWYLLRSRVPPLMAQALADVLQGSGPRLLRAAAVLLPAISILWLFASSIGRWVSLRVLLEDPRGNIGRVLSLHFLRCAVGLAAWIAYLGVFLFAALVANRGYEPRPGLFLLLFFVTAAVIAFVHSRIRWYLSLGTILAARDGEDAFTAVRTAFDRYRERRTAFASANVTVWLLRLSAMFLATVASLLPMVGLSAVQWRAAIAALVIITLAYFLAADFLHILALAAYVEILREESQPAPVPAEAIPPPPVGPTTDDQGPTAPQLETSS